MHGHSLAACVLIAAACSSKEDPGAAVAAREKADPRPSMEESNARIDPITDPKTERDSDPPIDADLETLAALRAGDVVSARPVSTRSMSIKVRLDNGTVAVFKPMRRDNGTARCEVAYYRLARLLDVGRVPPSVMRKLPVARLTALLRKGSAQTADAFEETVRIFPDGMVKGAMIAWVDGIAPSGLEGFHGRERMRSLLSIAGPAPRKEPIVAQASAMVALDYVLGNWDRYSGGNLFEDGNGDLVLIDNNAAFAPWSAGQLERSDDVLSICSRFPRALVERLRALTRKEVIEALRSGGHSEEGRLLTDTEIDRIFQRRDALMDRIDALVEANGETAILFEVPGPLPD